MQIAVLGPLEVRDDSGATVEVAGARLRTLLTSLAIEAGRPVSVGTLVDAVWGDAPPADESNALQTLVSRLRRALQDTGVVAQSASGYRLTVAPESVDAIVFARQAAAGSAALRRGEHRSALDTLTAALALWRGPALADTRDHGEQLGARAGELDDQRLAAVVDRVDAALGAGADVDLAELERLVADHPLHERLAGLLVRALAADGRTTDALQAYEGLRARLADELGVDPSAELRDLHLTLLRASDEPAARSSRRTNLKAQLTSFVGRDDEVTRIGKSLEQNRLVTLVGPGGAGKTRLASEAAAQSADTAPDGVWLAELATVTSGEDVAQAVYGCLGLREIHLMDGRPPASTRDALDRLRDVLEDKTVVLILDNCEHVIDATARLAEQLLGACADLRVLATSREPLAIMGEVLLAVPPLGQPALSATPSDALEFPAVQLFADRAAAVSPDFAVDDTTVRPVIEIVRRLDGLPLAIELAAARLRTMPLPDIAARLDDRFRLLTGGSRTALPRHRTLRAVVEWSWELLTDDERALVERLAVFPSGVTVASATAVRPETVPEYDVSDLLASIVDKSLLQRIGDGGRMRMLETIREFGIERLGDRDELGAARDRHARYFEELLTEAEPHLTTAGQLPWFALLSAERENILAALRYRCDVGDADAALHIAVSLGGFAMLLGEHSEVGQWVTDALAVPGGEDDNLRLIARTLQALNTTFQNSDDAGASARALKDIAVELTDCNPTGNPIIGLLRPAVAFVTDDAELVVRFAGEAVETGDEWTVAAVRMFLANMAENTGDVEAMRRETEFAVGEFRRLGERWGLASALRNLGQLLTLDGDLEAAAAAYEEALELMAELNTRDDQVQAYGRLADIALRRGDLASARRYASRAHDEMDGNPSALESVFAACILGEIEWRTGNVEVARRMLDDALVQLRVIRDDHPIAGHVRAMALTVAGRMAREMDGLDDPQDLADRALKAAISTHDQPIVAQTTVLQATLAADAERHRDSAELLGMAAKLRGSDDLTSIEVLELRERLVQAIGDDEFAAAYAAGKELVGADILARLDAYAPGS